MNITFTSFDIETNKDVLWLYTGLASDSGNDTLYPGFDNVNRPDTVTTYTEPNFWLEIYTDKNIVSQGFTFSISAGKNQLSTNQFQARPKGGGGAICATAPPFGSENRFFFFFCLLACLL